jgi:hypothetical protein
VALRAGRDADPAGRAVVRLGTWSSPGTFVSAGSTTGSLEPGPGGAATIDIPAATGAVAGAVLEDPFVLTWDGYGVSEPHWVDRAPGGTTPAGSEYGADYVVGGCGTPGGPGGTPGPGEAPLAAVALSAPAKRTGAGRVRVRGRVVPGRGGVPVELTQRGAPLIGQPLRWGGSSPKLGS